MIHTPPCHFVTSHEKQAQLTVATRKKVLVLQIFFVHSPLYICVCYNNIISFLNYAQFISIAIRSGRHPLKHMAATTFSIKLHDF